MRRARVHNVKAHFRVEGEEAREIPEELVQRQRHGNLCITWILPQPEDCPNRKFIVFDGCSVVSVTGLCDFDALERSASDYCQHLGQTLVSDSIAVDNCTVSGKLVNVDRRLLTRVAVGFRPSLTDANEVTVSARTRNFPGLLIRTRRKCEERRGTLTLFTTGKFVVLGSRGWSDIDGIVEATKRLLRGHGWSG